MHGYILHVNSCFLDSETISMRSFGLLSISEAKATDVRPLTSKMYEFKKFMSMVSDIPDRTCIKQCP